jgi:uncharacterized protein
MLFSSSNDRRFFALLRESAENMVEVAQIFSEAIENLDRSREYAIRLKDLEKKGDRFTHDLITLLNKMFVTPLEREDIFQLAVRLDDVVDGIEATASRLSIYRIRHSDQYIREFARIIQSQVSEIVVSIELLEKKELLKIRENTVQINVLENQGDEVLRAALGNLFETEKDPIHLIKLKEIYETLETATDRAEDVANTLEGVVMKNA